MFRGLTAEKSTVRCGEWDIKNNTDTQHQDIRANVIHIHPEFKLTKLSVPENDFALIHLAENFKLNPFVDTICLPDPSDPIMYKSNECFATGYGKDRFDK